MGGHPHSPSRPMTHGGRSGLGRWTGTGPDGGGGAPHRKRAVLLVLRYYGGQLVLLRRFALPGMLLPALGPTGLNYVAPLVVAALIGRFSAHGSVTTGEAVPYVLGFAGLLLLSEALWPGGPHWVQP